MPIAVAGGTGKAIHPDLHRMFHTPRQVRYLSVTQEGQQWIADLYANFFTMEHRGQLFKQARLAVFGASALIPEG